jgi:hypothetical protein
MSLSTAVPTVTGKWFDGARLHVHGTVAVGASPLTYAAGGLVMSFAIPGVQSTVKPSYVDVQGKSGFIYKYVKGTNAADGKLMVFCETTVATNAPLLEHTVTAVVAGVSGDTIDFYAIFKLR